MRKIPTLFVRDPADMRRVLPEVTTGCEWVLAGEGVATCKYDGTCVMLDSSGDWWARREVKPGKVAPENFVLINHDPATGKLMGWEPIEQSGWAKFHDEALTGTLHITPGTYELCGPRINRNPEGYDEHVLILHAGAQRYPLSAEALTFPVLRDILTDLGTRGWEGLVWHHPDGRMAKLKARDFPREIAPSGEHAPGPHHPAADGGPGAPS